MVIWPTRLCYAALWTLTRRDLSSDTSDRQRRAQTSATRDVVVTNDAHSYVSGTIKLRLVMPLIRYKALADDYQDGDLTTEIKVAGDVDTSKLGDYELIYTVTDKSGAVTTLKRSVTVVRCLPRHRHLMCRRFQRNSRWETSLTRRPMLQRLVLWRCDCGRRWISWHQQAWQLWAYFYCLTSLTEDRQGSNYQRCGWQANPWSV